MVERYKKHLMKKVCILTLGCKVNQYESEALSQMFRDEGFLTVSFIEKSDIYVINTCSVTNMSDRKSRQLIRKCIRENENAVIIVTGCYTQGSPDEVSKIEGVTAVVGNSEKEKIVEIAKESIENKTKIINVNKDVTGGFSFPALASYQEKTRAIIKIQDGCNSFCSYCIIPFVRGRCRSRSSDEIIEEINTLVKNGYKEIVLSGIHVCNYGIDTKDMTFPKLLSMIEEIDGVKRIRLSSIEPLAFTDEFLMFYKKTKKLCPHFHISLQSGSDTVIKRMNRHYTAQYFYETVMKLREINPLTEITTDVIVGFPEETDAEFKETLELIKRVGFLKVHTFKYSMRDGTVAAKMENQIDEKIKDTRSKIIIEESEKIEKSRIESYKGKKLSVLFEEEKDGFWHGFSDNYINVYVKSESDLTGKIFDVYIKDVKKLSAFGELS